MRYVFTLLPILLIGCGFQPMYGNAPAGTQSASARAEFAAIEVQTQNDRIGQLLKKDVEDRLNPDSARGESAYLLQVDGQTMTSPIAVSRDGTISRYNLTMTSNFTLTEKRTGLVLTRGNIRRTGSYNNPANAYYSTIVAEQDSTERVITEVAEELRMRLAAYFANPTPPEKTTPKTPTPSIFNPYETVPKIR